jgi:hypothetical protein
MKLPGDKTLTSARTTGLSHRTSFGKITSEGRRPDASGRTSESADPRRPAPADRQLVGLADGTWWTAIGRPGGPLRLGCPPGAVRPVETFEAHNY